MKIIAWDTETCLIRPGRLAPELVCVSYAGAEGQGVVDRHEGTELVRRWLADPGVVLVGHNVAYDVAVTCAHDASLIPAWFAAYDADRVRDTKLRAQLLDIAGGCYRGRLGPEQRWIKYGYSLDDLARRHLGLALDKDTWRLRYAELLDTPIAEWPEGARTYPLQDAVATLGAYDVQADIAARELADSGRALFEDEHRQARAALWLHLSSAWGLRTRPEGVARLREQTEAALAIVEERLKAVDIVRPNGTRDTKLAQMRMVEVCSAAGKPVRRTPAGGVALDADACKASGDEVLKDYAELTTLKAVLSKDVPALASGATYPVHTRYDLAETGRTTSASPNIQNWRRLPGIREAFVPRAGHVFIQADYEGLELRTLAQACLDLLGKSHLAEALNAGLDPHLALAGTILGMTYEEAKAHKKRADVDNARQTAKVANFGFPGGLGAPKLVLFARKAYGVLLTEARALELKEQWLRTWPEMRAYFALVGRMTDNPASAAMVRQLRSGRWRGGANYTAACNGFFQGLGADATKAAGWAVARAQYVERHSPLFGTRTVAYVHDELIGEALEARGHEAAVELERVMIAEASKWIPDVSISAPPLLMRYWSKDAHAIVRDGRLVPWSLESCTCETCGEKREKRGVAYAPEDACAA